MGRPEEGGSYRFEMSDTAGLRDTKQALRVVIVIGALMDLLEQQDSQTGIKFLGRSAKGVAEKGSQSIDGKFTKNMLPKKGGPRPIHELASLSTEKVPWIEKVEGFVITGVNHLFCL